MLAITPTNQRREVINELVQQARLARGELGERVANNTEQELIHVGDRVMFVGRNDRRRNLQNGLTGTVVGRIDGGELVMALNPEQTDVRVLPANYAAENLRLAYAVTDYKAQGATVEETVMVAAPEELSLNRGYVAASRARERTRLVLICPHSREQALADLDRHLRTREDDELAIEHIDKAASGRQPTRAAERWLSPHRSRIEELGREREQVGPLWATATHDRLAEIEARQQRMQSENQPRRALTGKDRRARALRDLALERLENEKRLAQAEVKQAEAQASRNWREWERITDERDTLIAQAAKEEAGLRINDRHAPWVYAALGPEPLEDQEGLTQRWSGMAEHLAGLRIDRGVTDPTDPGITKRDIMFVKDIRTLRGYVQAARELRVLRPGLIRGGYRPGFLGLPTLSRGYGRGIGD